MTGEPRGRCVEARSGAGTRRVPWLPLLLLSAGALVARGDDLTLNVDDARGVYRVHGAFTAPVSTAVAWAVLTDYDHIGDFVKSVRASHVEHRGNGWLLLRQDARGGTFPLQRTMHVQLDVREHPGRQITFADQLGQDFRVYNGEWIVRPAPGGADVQYTLDARPMAAMPRTLGRAWIGHAARELLTQVRMEMIRRGGGAPHPPLPRVEPVASPNAGSMDTP